MYSVGEKTEQSRWIALIAEVLLALCAPPCVAPMGCSMHESQHFCQDAATGGLLPCSSPSWKRNPMVTEKGCRAHAGSGHRLVALSEVM